MLVHAPEQYARWLRAAGAKPLAVPQGVPLDVQAADALAARAHLIWAPDPRASARNVERWTIAMAQEGLRLFPAYPLRYLAPLQRAIHHVRQGVLGEVAALRLIYRAPPGEPGWKERELHLADLYQQFTSAPLGPTFGFPGSPFRSGGGEGVPASLDLSDTPDMRVTAEVIGRNGTLLADGLGQYLTESNGGRRFVGDPPEPRLVAAFLAGQ